MIPKKTTKMIVKNGSGNLVQLLPEIEAASTIDASSDVPVSNAALASALEDIEDSLPASALLDVMDEEPTALNTTELDDEALIVWMEPPMPSWSITINTELAGAGEKTGQIPFDIRPYAYNENSSLLSMIVDWGDGNVTMHTSEDNDNTTDISHEYANAGIYTITISSENFNQLYIEQGYFKNIYCQTLIRINTPIPKIAGTNGMSWYDDATGRCDNSFYGCFSGCTSLASIPSNLFINNATAIDFDDCFRGCTSLASIPEGLFDSCTSVNEFLYCFEECTSLASIPEKLFEKNVAVTGLAGCFSNCSSLGDFNLHIGSSQINRLWEFVPLKTNAVRNIYVPSGSTTQTTFNAQASSLGLTIIGE